MMKKQTIITKNIMINTKGIPKGYVVARPLKTVALDFKSIFRILGSSFAKRGRKNPVLYVWAVAMSG